MFPIQPVKLRDCQRHGAGSDAELFIVEGDSASKNVVRVRDETFQAVLPMQGKPLNAKKASKQLVARHAFYQHLISALGAGWDDRFDLASLRYRRVVLLLDPDADGIHCGVLMLMFFHRWMPALLNEGHLCWVRPPLYQLVSPAGDRVFAYSDEHFVRLRRQLTDKQILFTSQRYRGLASIDADVLAEQCVCPRTRHLEILGQDDAVQAIHVFA